MRSDLESRKKVRVFNFGGGVLGKVRFGYLERKLEFSIRGCSG